ncbi:MAG TPA: PPOX class F420-dependent oxidoreductase [Amycolatopsis sp.]|nr:PPOX class F420-dependent oxidoreductase [Amycolatopsis sp.]
MIFTERELVYLRSQHLGRLGTIGPAGPQVRPTGFVLNDDGTIDIGGPENAKSQKWRNLQKNPAVSFLVDDMTPDEPGEVRPGWGRGIEIRGHAELLTDHDPPYGGSWFSREVIRIHPRRVNSWHLDPEQLQYNRKVA